MYKIALFAPLTPVKSGISYFTEEILPFFRSEYEIDIYVDGFKPTLKDVLENHKIYDIDEFNEKENKYDMALYQIGNNPYHCKIIDLAERYPGIIFLHDFALHHIYAHNSMVAQNDIEPYISLMRSVYGNEVADTARLRHVNGELGFWETDPLKYPLNENIVKKSTGAIVFSEFAKNRLLEQNLNTPIKSIALHPGDDSIELTKDDVIKAKKELGYNENDILICSFGFIQQTKRPFELLEAFKVLAEKNDNLRLIYIGEVQENAKSLKDNIKKYGLENKVRITGFTDEELFKKYLRACDINVSLRYPTVGETSGVLARSFLYGKPSIISDAGSFSEQSDEFTIKISYGENKVDEIISALDSLVTNKNKCEQMSIKAKKYADENLTLSITTKNMIDFINQIIEIDKVRKTESYSQIIKKYANTYYELNGSNTQNKQFEKIVNDINDVF